MCNAIYIYRITFSFHNSTFDDFINSLSCIKPLQRYEVFSETLLKKKKYWVIIFNNNSQEDIYLIFSKTKKNLKKIFHILPTCFKKMHIYLQTLMS